MLKQKNIRNSNIEILRIISMFLIVMHHYALHSGFAFDNTLSINRLYVQILSFGGKLGVNIFILITGYFLCKQTEFRLKSILKFIIQVTLFSSVIYIILLLTGDINFSIGSMVKNFLPLLYRIWWFASTYFILILLAPFISKCTQKMSRKEHLSLILLLTLIWCISSTFLFTKLEYNELLWFIYIYIIASYIRNYKVDFFDKYNKIILLLSFLFIILSFVTFDLLGTRINFFQRNTAHFIQMSSLPILLMSISFLCLFKNMKEIKSSAINKLSACMFGIYLIHDNPYIRKILWKIGRAHV